MNAGHFYLAWTQETQYATWTFGDVRRTLAADGEELLAK